MRNKSIGKVISVDSFRVFIRLDEDLKSLYKSGYEDIYEVARINSYVIIPIGADRIVAMVTSVRSVDETELSKNKEAIFLTKPARYLVATMIGTIGNTGKYIQGVYNYPVLDNPVLYVTRDDLNRIFDQKEDPLYTRKSIAKKTDESSKTKENDKIEFDEDYYLPIGTSPAFPDYKIKINPDKFFGKHAAILGNTGSGKSCTFAAIIQSLFDFSYNGSKLQSAHFVVFDTNGEYKQAFQGTEERPYVNLKEVNPFHIDKDGLKVPFWFMNYDDFDYLFEPTSGTQAPILKRALALAKNQTTASETKTIPPAYLSRLKALADECEENNWKIKNTVFDRINDFINELRTLDTDFDKSSLISALEELDDEHSKLSQPGNYVRGNLSTEVLQNCAYILNSELGKYNLSIANEAMAEDRNIDLPTFFKFKDLIDDYIDQAIGENTNENSNRMKEYISTLQLRMQSYLNDERLASPLLLNHIEQVPDFLAKFLAFILGDFCKVYNEIDGYIYDDDYTRYFSEKSEKSEIDACKPSQLTLIDMSLLPFEVLETVTGLIGRLILEFASRFDEDTRGTMPIVIALEEAQNYIPEKDRKEKESVSKRVFERIAREGRKYGVSLLVLSQRPSELSKTVLSQCNSFIVHRLQNPEDQKYVKQLVSAANEDILQQLPILPQQHVVIMGDAVRTPVQARMNTANPIPNSNNPRFIENWLKDSSPGFPDYKGIADAWEKGEKYTSSKEPTEEEEVAEGR